eukprot:CAMPEP_0118653670 /NCGR_PEP_ID=MMETSP0785-20121206/11950_1 /TAXON_ID=91992 /ORGANISM="Bolidomonas pacifica, Strain CCMP 1866" /LENGTH=302 /DNA_ID=CAMNT_0006546219 /DNA_START=226 /DNA_END=1131 /DNA_ORIENTATION=-
MLALSALPKLVIADELEEKIFDGRNVEKTLGLVFDKIMSKAAPYSVKMVAASIVNDLCSSPGIVKLVEKSERLRPFLVEGWVTLVKEGEDLAKEARSVAQVGGSRKPPLQPLIYCILSLHRHCKAVSQRTFAVLVLRNNNDNVAIQGASGGQQHKYDINVEVATPTGTRNSNRGAESVVHAILQLATDSHTPTAAAASKLLKCVLMAGSSPQPEEEARTEEEKNKAMRLREMVEDVRMRLWYGCESKRNITACEKLLRRARAVAERGDEDIVFSEPFLNAALDILCTMSASSTAAASILQSQ